MLLERELILERTGVLLSYRHYSGPTNKIFDVDVNAGETVLLEPAYPIVLEATGDQLVVGTGNYTGIAATYQLMVTGDKEV